jgi:hypothetical protein
LEARPSHIEEVNEYSLYPDEKLVWDTTQIPPGSFYGNQARQSILLRGRIAQLCCAISPSLTFFDLRKGSGIAQIKSAVPHIPGLFVEKLHSV